MIWVQQDKARDWLWVCSDLPSHSIFKPLGLGRGGDEEAWGGQDEFPWIWDADSSYMLLLHSECSDLSANAWDEDRGYGYGSDYQGPEPVEMEALLPRLVGLMYGA